MTPLWDQLARQETAHGPLILPTNVNDEQFTVQTANGLIWVYNVTLAKECVAAGRLLEMVTITVPDAAASIYPEGHVPTDAADSREVDVAYAMSSAVDIRIPPILVLLPGWITGDARDVAHYMIDGHHRVYRAHREGVTHLDGIVLTPDDEGACRLFPSTPALIAAARAAGHGALVEARARAQGIEVP